MEQQSIIHVNDQNPWLAMPKEILTYIIAHYHLKDTIRKTCASWHVIASSTNTNILTHPSLVLSEKALERFILYHGALGDSAIVRNLLAKGANPNAEDDKQMTLMHYAAEYGYIDIVDILLEHPDLITSNISKDNQSPFSLAIQYHQSAVIKRIFSACNLHGGNALCEAVKQESLTSVRTLLTCNIDANSPNEKGNYPLTFAAINGHTHIIKLLIINGARVNDFSKNPYVKLAPLHLAARYGYTSATELLIEYGSNVNIKGINAGITPLHCASERGHYHIVQILLNNNAHVNAISNNDSTPLDVAEKDNVKQLLIAYGGNTSAELKQLTLKKNKPEKDNCVIQ